MAKDLHPGDLGDDLDQAEAVVPKRITISKVVMYIYM